MSLLSALWRASVPHVRKHGAIGITVALIAASAASWAGNASPASAAVAGHCDGGRPAVATHTRGVRFAHQPKGAPVPCESFVGATSEAADVGVLTTGSVFYAPLLLNHGAPPSNVLAGPEDVVRSGDGGSSWSRLGSGGPTTGGLAPPWMDVDQETGRIWYVTPIMTGPFVACGARISWSDDAGRHWTTNLDVGCPAEGAEKLIEGPAPTGGAQPSGYTNVVYYCANENDGLPLPIYCYKSLNGGQTFTAVSGHPESALPPRCPTDSHPDRVGIVAIDGDLVFPSNVCGHLGAVISSDEGATWHYVPTRIKGVEDNMYTASIASDANGDLYIAYLGRNDRPRVTVTRDGGAHWSAPMTVVAPKVKVALRVAITAGRRGQIELSYLGTTNGHSYNGYITESDDVLARSPVFWSASVNRPRAPLVQGTPPTAFGDRTLYSTDALAPNGTAWAGFHCVRTRACPGERVGVVGSLERGR
jgi:hypothetical protein